MSAQTCRFCDTGLTHTLCDLGMSPLCESILAADQTNRMEPFYPLKVWVCQNCLLVQLEQYVSAEHIFTEYAYFSAFSTAWLEHAKSYVAMISERNSSSGVRRRTAARANDSVGSGGGGAEAVAAGGAGSPIGVAGADADGGLRDVSS